MISLIIPCFNEEESLPLFYPEATSVLRQMNCDYELIFVNDGSRDRTLEILKELSEKDPHVIYVCRLLQCRRRLCSSNGR